MTTETEPNIVDFIKNIVSASYLSNYHIDVKKSDDVAARYALNKVKDTITADFNRSIFDKLKTAILDYARPYGELYLKLDTDNAIDLMFKEHNVMVIHVFNRRVNMILDIILNRTVTDKNDQAECLTLIDSLISYIHVKHELLVRAVSEKTMSPVIQCNLKENTHVDQDNQTQSNTQASSSEDASSKASDQTSDSEGSVKTSS